MTKREIKKIQDKIQEVRDTFGDNDQTIAAKIMAKSSVKALEWVLSIAEKH